MFLSLDCSALKSFTLGLLLELIMRLQLMKLSIENIAIT